MNPETSSGFFNFPTTNIKSCTNPIQCHAELVEVWFVAQLPRIMLRQAQHDIEDCSNTSSNLPQNFRK